MVKYYSPDGLSVTCTDSQMCFNKSQGACTLLNYIHVQFSHSCDMLEELYMFELAF